MQRRSVNPAGPCRWIAGTSGLRCGDRIAYKWTRRGQTEWWRLSWECHQEGWESDDKPVPGPVWRKLCNLGDWTRSHDRISIWNSNAIESAVATTGGRQSPGLFLGTKCNGLDQLLDEERMMPRASMCSNSCFATERQSGARRRGRAATGGPLVSMWCVTPCLTSRSGENACNRVGNSERSEVKGSSATCSCVVESHNRLCFMSTWSAKWRRKSAPMRKSVAIPDWGLLDECQT